MALLGKTSYDRMKRGLVKLFKRNIKISMSRRFGISRSIIIKIKCNFLATYWAILKKKKLKTCVNKKNNKVIIRANGTRTGREYPCEVPPHRIKEITHISNQLFRKALIPVTRGTIPCNCPTTSNFYVKKFKLVRNNGKGKRKSS